MGQVIMVNSDDGCGAVENGRLQQAGGAADETLSGKCHRRRFLQIMKSSVESAVVAPFAVSFPLAISGAEPQWKLRLSTSSIHFMHLPIEEACRRIAELGFQAVDIWSAHAGCPHLDDVVERLGADGFRKLLAETGLRLFAFSVYQGGYPRYAQLLGESGGGVAVRGSTGPCEPNQITARTRQFLESLKPQVELAEKYDSYLAIENHGNALLDSLDSLKAFVDLNRSRRLGIALAPYHLQAIGAAVEEAIEICGNQLLFFYAWQKAADVQQLPGHGKTNFTPWLSALAKVQYEGYVNPFMHGDLEPAAMSMALGKSRHYLQQCDERRKAQA